MDRRVASLLTSFLPTAGCGFGGYEVLANDPTAPDASFYGTPDGSGTQLAGRFRDLCDASAATVILDGDRTDDEVATWLGVAVERACGLALRTVHQDDPGILDRSDSRPLLGPDDLGLVGGDSSHADVMDYLQRHDTPLLSSWWLTMFVLRDRETDELVVARSYWRIDRTHDVGVVEVTVEPIGGTTVLTVFGARDAGARAAAYYFEHVIAPSLATDEHVYYVIDWVDRDGDASPSMGDTFSVVAAR